MSRFDNGFEIIYRDYYKRIFAFMMKLCGDADVSEDLTQETFLQAYSSMYKYNGECEMFTWLAAIAKRVFLKYLRRAKEKTIDMDMLVIDLAAPEDTEPWSRVHRQVEVAALRKAIKKLPEKYSDVLILRLYGDLPYAEIGRKLGISENSAKVIFYRAKNQIKEELLHE